MEVVFGSRRRGDWCIMENNFGLDLDDIFNVVDHADVILVRFQIVEQRLLIDLRTNSTDGPMICLVPRVGSSEERFRSLKRLRPRFPLPDRIVSFQWPRQVASLEAAGVWERIRSRLITAGSDESRKRCDQVYQELVQHERRETIAAIRGGDGYETVWERRT
jgi:hypothetical protein